MVLVFICLVFFSVRFFPVPVHTFRCVSAVRENGGAGEGTGELFCVWQGEIKGGSGDGGMILVAASKVTVSCLFVFYLACFSAGKCAEGARYS